MAGFGSLAQGLSDGLRNGASINSMMSRLEQDELSKQEQRGRIEDAQRAREAAQGRRDDLKLAAQPPAAAPAADGTQQAAPRQPERYEIFEAAARRRFDAGDVEGYEQFLNKGAAEKTRFFTERLEDAYRRNDLAGGLALLNQFPDGVSYDIERGENGALTGVAKQGDKEMGRQPFKSEAEAWSFISQRAKPGDIFGSLRQMARDEIEGRKNEAEINLKGAQTDAAKAAAAASQASADRQSADAEVTRQYGPQEAQARVSLIRAQTSAAGRANDNTPSSLREIDGLRQRGFSPEEAVGLVYAKGGSGKSLDADSILAARKELLDSYTDPVKRSQLSEDEVALAKRLLQSSQTPSGRGFGRPIAAPAAPAAAPANRPPLSSFQK